MIDRTINKRSILSVATVFLLFIVSVWVCQFKCVSCFQNTTSLKLLRSYPKILGSLSR